MPGNGPPEVETYLGPTPQRRGQPLGQPPAAAPQAALLLSLQEGAKRGGELWGLCEAVGGKGGAPSPAATPLTYDGVTAPLRAGVWCMGLSSCTCTCTGKAKPSVALPHTLPVTMGHCHRTPDLKLTYLRGTALQQASQAPLHWSWPMQQGSGWPRAVGVIVWEHNTRDAWGMAPAPHVPPVLHEWP